ncbi:SUMF1/EgtB/PvdO family nonheme iron enzyme [Parabacteroides sp. PF5-6]|uniref:type IX secretion system lipoprotein PorK/GldK n=1 Tax=Parabacteroides sp. PF5-6 TaxID=1742403 RepID=UPI002405F9FC|nr:SUMF1/EgtB/PvdO family nonheme iron enzyme [Parabacteroides sp. PF5-6]MDF9830092.1 sulfatase modifying factor 1 [Parabacteroides sp. PF5-6]
MKIEVRSKKINIFLVLIAMGLLTTSCGRSLRGSGGEVTGVRLAAVNEPTPYGMVLVKRGAFEMGPSDKDSLWGMMPETKGVSFDAFWMDQTEVTNAKYRQFVNYVRDSIIRERLYDPQFGGNELFKITDDRYGDPIEPYLDWSRPIPWKRASEEEEMAIESIYYTHPVTGEKKLDPAQMYYKYEWYDYTSAALRKNRLNPYERIRNTDLTVNPDEVVMISKDTAYIDDEGRIVNETITRPLSSEWDFLHTRIVAIYPDETVWINDFNNAYNEPYMRMYFNHPGYDDYPVVGVSWEMATAYCVWRTNTFKESLNLPAGQNIEPFRLPTEGEWEYAARTGKNENKYPWSSDDLQSSKGCFLANFKPGDGDYTQDGHIITSRTGSFAPNEFGLYDMAGNVAEWTSTSFSESGPTQMSDMNPELHYDAAKEDPYAMKKKVVRGGSWKDVAQFIRSDMRTSEYQNETRSYIGFRCARTQVGFSKSKGKK